MFRFPWGDFHSLNLGWFLQKFNELREDWATAEAGIDGALDAEIQKAEDALTDVFAARDAAAASASAANSSALNASQSSLASMDARDQSRAARDAAQQAATNSAASETAAGNSATAASNSAGAAATSATQAGNSATAAGNSATAAGNSATAAGNSATAAAGSATAAAGSATAAEASAQRAEEVEESIPAEYTELSNLTDALANSFPSVLTPMKNAQSGASGGLSRSGGIFTINPLGGTASLTLYDSVLLPPGTYKFITNIIKNTIESEFSSRIGYIAVRTGSKYSPIVNITPGSILSPQRIENIFTVTTEANYTVIASIINNNATGGEAIVQAYIEMAQPTAPGLSSVIRDPISDTLSERNDEVKE